MSSQSNLSFRSHLAQLPPYLPIEPFEVLSAKLGLPADQIIKLDANENPFGLTDKIQTALQNLAYAHIYPDPESRTLRHALATFIGTPAENILAGAGADELIDLIMRVYLDPKDYILNLPPTFGMYTFDAQVNAGQVINIPRTPDFSIDLDAITMAVNKYRPKLVFIASPNNPDGSCLTENMINRLLELPVITVLDEAYIEFADPNSCGNEISFCRHVQTRENLIVLRTFSKWAGLAGLRVGYGCFPDWMMPTLWKAKQPYNVNVAASSAALAALDDLQTLTNRLKKLTASRLRLYHALQKIPFLEPYPSQANFVLCRVLDIPAEHLKNILAQNYGILIRYFAKPGLQDHIRISVGKDEHIEALLQAFNKIGEEL